MSALEPKLKTQQVADALGIGVSTLKRWIDAGQLQAERSIGRHRLISPAEALRFARDQRFQTSKLERLIAEKTDTEIFENKLIEEFPLGELDAAYESTLLDTLKDGDRAEAKRQITNAHKLLGQAARLGDELICPVMRKVGEGWSNATWDIFEEHQASQIVASSLQELIDQTPAVRPTAAPLAIGAVPEGDHATIALLLGELTLRELGWNVKNLGPNLPLRSLARAVHLHRPALVFITQCHIVDPILFQNELVSLAEAVREIGSRLVIGGRALTEEQLQVIPGAMFGRRLAHLRQFGQDTMFDRDPSHN